jgi:signal transduction histidine kinase
MKLFISGKVVFFILVLVTAFLSGILLYVLNCPVSFIILLTAFYIAGSGAAAVYEYVTKRGFYNSFFDILDETEKKRFISEIIETPSFYEGILLMDALKSVNKSANDELAVYEREKREYREYVEMWVHEIKTPISGIKLICENNGYANVEAELEKVEKYVEQALFYARSGSVEKDYIIKEVDMKELIGGFVKNNAAYLIGNKIRVELNASGKAFADSKWLLFIMRQITDNSVKYGAKSIVYTYAGNILKINDDGVGIPEKDLKRIFERGFTGENGRNTAKSTGMGLYLCKTLCDKLGLEISASSYGAGTEITVKFPENSYVTFL